MRDLNSVIDQAVDQILGDVAAYVATAVSERARARIHDNGGKQLGGPRMVRAKRRARKLKAIAVWQPNADARRVPNFVIEQTGLKTKMEIVRKYGATVTFRLGAKPPRPIMERMPKRRPGAAVATNEQAASQ